jgi:SSS family solute:Na+ symporter
MAQNFWTATWAWVACFVITIAVSRLSAPKAEGELKGLVYSLTPQPEAENIPWFKRPGPLGVVILGLVTILNVIFW